MPRFGGAFFRAQWSDSSLILVAAMRLLPRPRRRRRRSRAKSPTSQKVAFRRLRAGAELDLEDAMIMEYRLSQRFMAGHDFYKGVRAVVLYKDRPPGWGPDRLED